MPPQEQITTKIYKETLKILRMIAAKNDERMVRLIHRLAVQEATRINFQFP